MAITSKNSFAQQEKLTLFSALSASGDGTSFQLDADNSESVIYVRWSAGVTAGQVVVETASDETYTGTWSNLATINFTADKEDSAAITGAYAAVRVRISIALVGGTVTAFAFFGRQS